MRCLVCESELVKGRIKINSAYRVRMFFTRIDENQVPFIRKLVAGTIFDKADENELNIIDSTKKQNSIDSMFCPKCQIISIELGNRNKN